MILRLLLLFPTGSGETNFGTDELSAFVLAAAHELRVRSVRHDFDFVDGKQMVFFEFGCIRK